MAVNAFSKTGSKSSTKVTAPKSIFGEDVKNNELLKQAFLSYEANARQKLAQAKTRSEVRGGGRKPWRQKGTGRARVGSIRSPLWRSGGTIFGPTADRNYKTKLNKRSAQKALKQALTLAEQEGRVSVIDEYKVDDGKTKTAAKIFKNMDVSRGAVVVSDNPDAFTIKATRNLPFVILLSQPSLTAYDVLRAHHIIFTKSALKSLEERLKEAK